MWYKLNPGSTSKGVPADGHFGVLQRFKLPAPTETPRLLNTFDAPRLRTETRRSAVMVVESAAGGFSLRELASHARQD